MVAVGQDFGIRLAAAVLFGTGTAMVYPTLLAGIGDVAHPVWRARSVGIYRLWRDGRFAVCALLAGIFADAYGIPAAVIAIAALPPVSGIFVAVRMRGTDHKPAAQGRLADDGGLWNTRGDPPRLSRSFSHVLLPL